MKTVQEYHSVINYITMRNISDTFHLLIVPIVLDINIDYFPDIFYSTFYSTVYDTTVCIHSISMNCPFLLSSTDILYNTVHYNTIYYSAVMYVLISNISMTPLVLILSVPNIGYFPVMFSVTIGPTGNITDDPRS